MKQPYTLLGEPCPKLMEIYLKEFQEQQYPATLARLRKIDRLRNKWIEAQNELIHYTHALDKDLFANPLAARRWYEFYSAGGLTADDWKSYYKTNKGRMQDDPNIKIRNLRVVARAESEDE